ncbi:carboxylesterase/lipase family protein [Williamsia phyllosphaerae]|uniref:Carboxylic ester hydrolase n=1 Tax=Williamsia phyllosphaerae TaxID=885042 RepID=A0ABQ1V210_9NOCA|nr:carboxylesterase family protein [Williamsia phyllosphaerae]GGF34614.1 carboxylic ester hydrolase [Williamsia phyllosphaerae]
MKRTLCAFAVLALLATAGCTATRDDSAPVDAPLTVSTTSGVLHGKAGPNTRQFLGIRYAAAPTGDKRWTLPQAVDDPNSDVDASAPGAQCEQTPTPGASAPAPSEDCLFVNVTTPRTAAPEARLPVMVWWHGGGYTTDSGAEYDPQRLADAGNVMVVTVNYRLGIFGYLALPGLDGGGNFGFADQLESLRWVQRNAAAFGGDPDNVTVFGQSAGAMSTCAALTSPAARGLIDKAIVSSGSCALVFPTNALYPGVPAQRPYASVAQATSTGSDAARALRCDGDAAAECLRRLPPSALLTQNENFSNTLAYGTPLLPRDPREAVATGATLRIPMISGGNRDENSAFVAGALAVNPSAFTAQGYDGDLRAAYGERAGDVAQRYPLSRYASAGAALARTFTDAGWACPTVRSARQYAEHTKVYSYEFSDDTGPNVSGGSSPQVPKAAFHANDLPYVFDLQGRDLVPSGPQAELSKQMIGYWSSFAHTGTPSAAGAPVWPATTPDRAPVLGFTSSGMRLVDQAADHQCAFWDTVTLP